MDGELKSILTSTKPNFSLLPGGWEPPENLIPVLDSRIGASFQCLPINVGVGLVARNILSKKDCQALIQLMQQSPNTEGVSVQGRKDIPDYRVGSVRTTLWAPTLAMRLWEKVTGIVPVRCMTPLDATDWWQGERNRTKWEPIGFSPMLRFMRYDAGGEHYAHYDAGFIYPNDSYRTLQSVVIYLTTNTCGGATRFIRDGQEKRPIWDRDHRDWTREVHDDEVLFASQPEQGQILIFDHRLCHDVQKYNGAEPRIIIRGDVLFKAKV